MGAPGASLKGERRRLGRSAELERGGEGRSEQGAVNSGASTLRSRLSEVTGGTAATAAPPRPQYTPKSGGNNTLVLSARAPLHVSSERVSWTASLLVGLAHITHRQLRSLERSLWSQLVELPSPRRPIRPRLGSGALLKSSRSPPFFS